MALGAARRPREQDDPAQDANGAERLEGARRSPRSAPASTTATAGSRVATMLASLEGSRRRASM